LYETITFAKTIGGSADDVAWSIIQSSDGGYVVAGWTWSFGAGGDIYVVKLDSSGNVQWTKTIGGISYDRANSIIRSSDGGYAVAGKTSSFGAGYGDMYVVKMGPHFEICYSQTITNYSVSSGGGVSSGGSVSSPTPATSAVSPTVSFGGSVTTVCSSAGAPPLPMCYISGGCDYGSGMGVGSNDVMVELRRTTKGEGKGKGEGGKSKEEMKSYGCSAGGVLSRFLIPASMLIIIYGQLRKKRKKKKV
jgi:hypothetical protein